MNVDSNPTIDEEQDDLLNSRLKSLLSSISKKNVDRNPVINEAQSESKPRRTNIFSYPSFLVAITPVIESTNLESSSQVDSSIQEVVIQENYFCDYCRKWCKNRVAKHRHSMRWHKSQYVKDRETQLEQLKTGKTYSCDYCSKTFPNPRAKFVHRRSAHKDFIEKKINLLKKSINQQNNAESGSSEQTKKWVGQLDEREIMDVNEHPCDYCPEVFDNQLSRWEHKKKFHKQEYEDERKDDVIFECRFCPKTYLKAGGRAVHERYMHTNIIKPSKKKTEYHCEICSATFENSVEKYNHKNKMHKKKNSKGPSTCDYCSATFPTSHRKWLHKIKEHNEEYKRDRSKLRTFSEYKCDYCPESFPNSQEKWKHKNQEHPEEYERDKSRSKLATEHICDYCPEKFQTSLDKWYHKQKEHLEEYQRDKGKTFRKRRSKLTDEYEDSNESPEDSINAVLEPTAEPSTKSTQIDDDSPHIQCNIEKSPMPLSLAIFKNVQQNPQKIIIVWCKRLEVDLLLSVSMNPSQALLSVEDLDICRQTDTVKDILKRSETIGFNVLKSDDSTSQWTLITFSEQGPASGLANKLLMGYDKVEDILTKYATSKEMNITHLMRYSKEELYKYLPQQLIGKVTVCNFSE